MNARAIKPNFISRIEDESKGLIILTLTEINSLNRDEIQSRVISENNVTIELRLRVKISSR